MTKIVCLYHDGSTFSRGEGALSIMTFDHFEEGYDLFTTDELGQLSLFGSIPPERRDAADRVVTFTKDTAEAIRLLEKMVTPKEDQP